ncbi:MAG: NAD(+) diphosphatase, partial [Pyrinomonadaceae bacterium]
FKEFGLGFQDSHYLGEYCEQHCYAVQLDEGCEVAAGFVLENLRAVAMALEDTLFAVAGRALQILHWDKTHRYCGQCGGPTQRLREEHARKCSACGLLYFPRLSPAVIVLVCRGRELLLGRSSHLPPGMHSILAGFVEPGENLEQAVEREVMEETGIRVKNLRYFGSQPWPFPHSLMIGFMADYAGGELQVDHAELEDGGWYSIDNLPLLPPKISIARKLIDAFLEGQEQPKLI